MPRFFAPDQHTPGQLNEPWQIGDVFSFVHGPDIRNVYFFRVLRVNADGSCWRGEGATELAEDGQERFKKPLAEFFARVELSGFTQHRGCTEL